MKAILLCLCLVGTTCAVPLRKPRRAGFGSKSEEMMPFSPYAYMNSPQLAQLAASLYGYRSSLPQLFAQQPIFPLNRFLWPPQTPVHQAARLPQPNAPQTPVVKQPHRPPPRPQLPQKPTHHQQPQPQPLPKYPQYSNPAEPAQPHPQGPVQQPSGGNQPPQAFPPNQQQPWHFPQIFNQGGFQPQQFGPFQGRMPAGFGRPPVSNEEGTPYFGYGFQGFGARPYNSEELEREYEQAKEKEPPKADPATNATDTNSTILEPAGQGGNATNSGLILPSNGANSPNHESRFLSANEVPTPPPTVLIPGGNGPAQNGIAQSSPRDNSPNIEDNQGFPSDRQQSTGYGSHVYKPHPEMGETMHNTFISRGNPSGHPEKPVYQSVYGENSRDNIQIKNSHPPSMHTRPNIYGQQEQPHYQRRNPSDQRDITLFPSSEPQSQWNRDPAYRDNVLKRFPPEDHSLDPRFNALGRVENTFNAREDADRFQLSGIHQRSSLSPQGIFSATRKTPSEADLHPYDWKKQVLIPSDHEREQFPPPQDRMWNNQEDPQVFPQDPPRYNSMHSSGSFNQREHGTYPEKNPYRQHFFYPSMWKSRENSHTIGSVDQRENPSYPPAVPSNQMQRNSYHRSDAFVQPGNDQYPRQNPWTHEKPMVDLDRQYRNPPYNPTEHNVYSKYSTDTPANQRGNLPYEEIKRWSPEEHPPVYDGDRLRQPENIPYHANSWFQPREGNLQDQELRSPLQITPLIQIGSQPSEQDSWRSQLGGPSHQKETSPYFLSYNTDLERTPTHTEDARETLQGGALISSPLTAEGKSYPSTLEHPDDYAREPQIIASYPTSTHLGCPDESPVPRENLPAPLRSAPHFRLASWEHIQSATYPEDGYSKHFRDAPYPAGLQSSQGNNSMKTGKSAPNQRENMDIFGEEVAGTENSLPCSKTQFGQQNGHEANREFGLPPTKNEPCYGHNIRGDGNNIPVRLMGPIQSKREHKRDAFVKRIPEKVFPPEGIQSAPLGSEDNKKKQHAVSGFKRLPCFRNQLKQYLSSTAAPSGGKPQDLFYAGNPMSTGTSDIRPPPEPQPISSTNPSEDDDEKYPLKSISPREDLADKPHEKSPDCLLLQKE